MYQYNQVDTTLVNERVAQFRDQTNRYLNGEIPDKLFLVLRLQNGLYIQRHAPMLRVSIPYGLLSSRQLRMLAKIAVKYDKNYGHFTTRQNIQFNWPNLEQVPDILEDLASVEMHAIQTSGNCIRNITSDELAGVDPNELLDPRPYCELIRQWATFHPEFAFLPRKFKIAVTANPIDDRAAVYVHDIGLQILKKDDQVGFRVIVGGGLGRTPVIGSVINEFVPESDIITYLEAILRVYNRFGRRDNKYKARIKILVKAMGPDAFRDAVAQHLSDIPDTQLSVPAKEIDRLKSYFTEPNYQILPNHHELFDQAVNSNAAFKAWVDTNVKPHKKSGYVAVMISLKKTGIAPGDVTGEQMDAIAELADRFSFGELRVTHKQNLVFADVRQKDLYSLWQQLVHWDLATDNYDLITDVICCPGGDFCSLANAKSIPIAQAIQAVVDSEYDAKDIGELSINISGCMNACGHHHVGNIGIIGVDKKGREFYQVALGGRADHAAQIGKIVGPSFEQEQLTSVIRSIINTYLDLRDSNEPFIQLLTRVGHEPFKRAIYDDIAAKN